MHWIDWLSNACLGLGIVTLGIGSLGLIRLPDFFARTHAVSVTDTAASGFIILGLILDSGLNLVSAKLTILIMLILLTSPTSSHTLSQAALMGGLRPSGKDETESGPER